MVDKRKPNHHWLSRTLRARDNGAADTIRWLHGAMHRTTTRIKPTSGEKACGFLARRGLSAAPFGLFSCGGDVYSRLFVLLPYTVEPAKLLTAADELLRRHRQFPSTPVRSATGRR